MHTQLPNRLVNLCLSIVALVLLCTSSALAVPIDDFIITIKTDNPGSSGNTSFELDFPIGVPFDIDWENDGTFDQTTSGGQISAAHDYGASGNYTIRIRGQFNTLSFEGGGDIRKLISLDQWGSNVWTSTKKLFFLAQNLEIAATDIPDFSLVTNMSAMFYGASLANPDTSNWNTTSVITMAEMFRLAVSANPDVDGWATSSVNDMSSMFEQASLANPNVSNWNTALLSNANSMFMLAAAATPDISNWNVSSLSDAGNMFFGVTLPDTLYDSILINWSAQSLQNGVSFSAGNSSYCSVQAAAARAAIILNFSWAISDAGQVCTTADAFITSWNTGLSGTSGLNQITVPMLGGPYEVDWDNDGIYDQSGITGPITHTFGPVGLHTIRIRGSFNTIRFNNADDKLKILSVDQWGNHVWTSMELAFYGAANLLVPATDTPDLSGATTLRRMFSGAGQANPDVSNWDTSTITNVASMFRDATLANPDVSNWNTAMISGAASMFRNASSFNRDLSNWNIGVLGNAALMFSGSALSSGNYDRLLISWSGQTHLSNILLGAANANYCSALAVSARAALISDGWSINDAGPGRASAPASPPDLLASSDSGVAATDNVTNDTTPTFELICSSADDTLKLYSNQPAPETLLHSHACEGVGTVNITTPGLADATHLITYTRVLAGIESSPSSNLTLIVDTLPPVGPGFLISPASPTRDVLTDLIGSCGIDAGSGTVRVTTNPANGFNKLEYGQPLFLFLGGEITINNPDWNDGIWDVYFNCTDKAGNGPAQFGPFGPAIVETSCDGTDVVIRAGFTTGIYRCQGSNSITTAGAVTISPDAVVHFQSPKAELGTEFKIETGASFTSTTVLGNTPPHIAGPAQLQGIIGNTLVFGDTHDCTDYEDGSLPFTPFDTGSLSGPAGSEFFLLECTDLNGALTQKVVEVIKN